MGKNERVSKGVKIFFVLSLVISFFMNLHSVVVGLFPLVRIGGCFGLVSCGIALIYALKGFSKDAAKFYKLFMILAFLSFQLSACSSGIQMDGAYAGVLVGVHCLMASFVLTLMLSSNLGKKLSMAFCWSMLAISFALVIVLLCVLPGALRGGTLEGSTALFRSCSNCSVTQVILSMTMAKYQDKTARGTK